MRTAHERNLAALAFVLSIVTATTAASKDESGAFEVTGTISCENWVIYRNQMGWEEAGAEAWISGFMTAFNFATTSLYSIRGNVDHQDIYLWMDKYCQANPLNNIAFGMAELVAELWPNRVVKAPND